MLTYPFWLTSVLYRQMTGVRASEMLGEIMVAMAPSLEPRDRQSMINRLERELPAPDERPVMRINRRTKRDPAKAREYFEQLGAIVE